MGLGLRVYGSGSRVEGLRFREATNKDCKNGTGVVTGIESITEL